MKALAVFFKLAEMVLDATSIPERDQPPYSNNGSSFPLSRSTATATVLLARGGLLMKKTHAWVHIKIGSPQDPPGS